MVRVFAGAVLALLFSGEAVTSVSGEVFPYVFSSPTVGFLGFTSVSGLASIRISSPIGPPGAPIVNVGNITYTARANAATATIPTLSTWGMFLTILMLLLTARARWRGRQPARRASSTGIPNPR